ncbi:hypothetical protein BJ546DRAFT_949667 [Cryomyces antarcticus]
MLGAPYCKAPASWFSKSKDCTCRRVEVSRQPRRHESDAVLHGPSRRISGASSPTSAGNGAVVITEMQFLNSFKADFPSYSCHEGWYEEPNKGKMPCEFSSHVSLATMWVWQPCEKTGEQSFTTNLMAE